MERPGITQFNWRERFGLFLAIAAGLLLLIIAARIHEVSNQAGGDLDSLGRERLAVQYLTKLQTFEYTFADYRYLAFLNVPESQVLAAKAATDSAFHNVEQFNNGPGAVFAITPQVKAAGDSLSAFERHADSLAQSQGASIKLVAVFDALEENSRLVYEPNIAAANLSDIAFANQPRILRTVSYSSIIASTFARSRKMALARRVDLAIVLHGMAGLTKSATDDVNAIKQQTGDASRYAGLADEVSAGVKRWTRLADSFSGMTVQDSPALSVRTIEAQRAPAIAAVKRVDRLLNEALTNNLSGRMTLENERRGLYQFGTILAGMFLLGIMLEIVRFVARHDRDALRRAQEESSKLAAELAREHAEKALALTEAQFRAVFDGAAIGIAILDRDAQVVDANSVFRDHFGRDATIFLDGRKSDLEAVLTGQQELFEFEQHYIPDGRDEHWVDATVSVVNDGAGKPQFAMCMFRDITDIRRNERRMVHDMTHDRLTGLPNRVLFETQLRDRFAESSTLLDSFFAVLFVDLDHFKDFNESLGHSAGDSVLQQVGARLRASLDPHDLVARLGSDEFAVLIRSLGDILHVESVARRIINNVCKPIQIGDRAVFAACSIGIAIGSATYERAEDVMRDANTAMSQAKSTGGSRYALFDSNMHARAERRLQLTTDLRLALQRGEFRMLYQPIVRVADGQLVGCEALLRWDHPTEGMILPGDFISLAEQTGIAIPIGKFVFETACRQLAKWRGNWAHAPEPTFSMSVNVSASEIYDSEFEDFVVGICQRYGVDPREMTLEITESVVLDSNTRANLLFERLQAKGFKICIDDFGTGYSSLRYLQQFRIDQLKIDRSFVAAADGEIASEPIVRTLMTLAEAFDLRVVAEGVETQRQRDMLRQAGCRFAQGYYYSRAVSAEDLSLMYPDVLARTAGTKTATA